MNIFEEIAESYKYNGVVSIKALEDDIVTLENQIDSYNSTLRELQLRGKKSGSLVEKMRDAKMRLSMLKAVLKKEKDKATPDDIIMNMLGLSAKNANETEMPGTAADQKEPVLQNFEKAEIEIVSDEVNSAAIESETLDEKEVVVENIENDEITVPDVVVEKEKQNDIDSGSKFDNMKENESGIIREEQEQVNECEAIPNKNDITFGSNSIAFDYSVIKPGVIDEKENEVIAFNNIFKNKTDYIIPAREKNNVEDKTIAEMEKSKDTGQEFEIAKNGNEELAEFHSSLTFEMNKGELDVPVQECPPPTADDYFEPIETQEATVSYDEKGEEYVEMPQYYDDKADTYYETVQMSSDMNKDFVTAEIETDTNTDYDIYGLFPQEKVGLCASLILTDVTNLVNTMRVYGHIVPEKRILDIRFVDIRDYEVFVKLLKEREEEKHNIFKRLFKKPKSIFMYVTVTVGDYVKKYVFEFTKCRIKEILDTEYASNISIGSKNASLEDCTYHNCGVTFKYKNLKIE